jgi:hypothetical protein
MKKICYLFGLNPLAAAGMVTADLMLFGGEASTLGASWPISVCAAIPLSLACVLIQRFSTKDPWAMAIGKGLLVGVLTAIPTPLPSILTTASGFLGAADAFIKK